MRPASKHHILQQQALQRAVKLVAQQGSATACGQRECKYSLVRPEVVDSIIPALMAIIFLGLMLYFKSIGGYKPLSIDEKQ